MSIKEKKVPKKKSRRFKEVNDEEILIKIFNNHAPKTVKTEPISAASNFGPDDFSPLSSMQNSHSFGVHGHIHTNSQHTHDKGIRGSFPFDSEIRTNTNNRSHDQGWKNNTTDLSNQVFLKNGSYFQRSIETEYSLREHNKWRKGKKKNILDSMNSLPIKRYAVKGSGNCRLLDSRDDEPQGRRMGLGERHGELHELRQQLRRVRRREARQLLRQGLHKPVILIHF